DTKLAAFVHGNTQTIWDGLFQKRSGRVVENTGTSWVRSRPVNPNQGIVKRKARGRIGNEAVAGTGSGLLPAASASVGGGGCSKARFIRSPILIASASPRTTRP